MAGAGVEVKNQNRKNENMKVRQKISVQL